MSNILRSKDNQAIKFGQLIEYNMRNIFLKDRTQNVVDKLFSESFLKYENLAYLWISSLSFIKLVFIVCLFKPCQNIVKPSCRSLTFTLYVF